jgi:hypothetical protein
MRKPTLNSLKFPVWLGKYGYLILFSLLTQIFSILHPKNPSISGSPAALCNYYITKLNIFNVHIDCDSQYFLLDSQNPMRLFDDQTPLQDRPLHTFLVFIISKVFGFVGIPSGSTTYLGEDNIPQTYDIMNYGIFIAINALILIAAVLIVLRVMLKDGSTHGRYLKASVFLAILLITQNPINREYFWTPHSQIFNLLIPAILFYFVQKDFTLTKRRFYIILFLISFSLLAYPTFTILLPVFFLITWKSLGKLYAILIAVSLIPKFLWPVVLNAFGGHYLDWPLVGHRRFVWILDSFKAKTLVQDLEANLSAFMQSLPWLWALITLFVVIIGIHYLMSLRHTVTKSTRSDLTISAVAFFTYLFGMILNGEYGPRFTTGVVLLLSLLVLNEVSALTTKLKYSYIAYSGIFLANCWFWLAN